MAPAVEASAPFHRSHSTPDLLGGMPKSPPSNLGSLTLSQGRNLNLKSLPSLPAFDVPSFDLDTDFHASLRLDFPTEKLKVVRDEKTVEVRSESLQPAIAIVSKAGKPRAEKDKTSRRISMIERPRSWLPSSKSTPNVRGLVDEELREPRKLYKVNGISDQDFAPTPLERPKTVESFAEFARRSWMSPSRSPSPPSRQADRADKRGTRRASLGPPKTKFSLGSWKAADNGAGEVSDSKHNEPVDRSTESPPPNGATRTLNRASVYLTKIKQSPQNVFANRSFSLPMSAASAPSTADSDNTSSTVQSARSRSGSLSKRSASNNDKADSLVPQIVVASSNPRSSSHTTSSAASDVTGAPSENASQATADTGLTMPHPTSQDPHWSIFRNLDDELPGFAAKTETSARMAVVRATLIPFLRSTALHPSNTDKSVLSPEDVERRATVLNRWWNELLRMLDGNSARPGLASTGATPEAIPHVAASPIQPVAGVDRPTLLEATTLIMMRPEWRLCTSYFQPLRQRSPNERVRARSWTQSTSGDETELATILMESAEHNIRTMFVNNLLRQMAIVVDKMSQRHAPTSLVNWCGKACAYAFFFVPGIADVLVRLWPINTDLLRRTADELGLPRASKGESEDIVALFPPTLGKLGWSSVRTLERKLRAATKLPLVTAQIAWNGPWVSRWRGADTDLLFIFTKYYYILAEEFVPGELPLVEKARGPAFVLLHAQLLGTLDATIHRHETLENWAVMESAEAVALPLPGNNLLKEMDENRIIILLKDMLADAMVGPTISEAFVAVMKAAAKKTSIYNTSACCVMLDFFEQLLALKVVVDLSYWLETFKLILTRSENSLSEIKLITFLYSVWDEITADPTMKQAICCDWLLSEEVWNKYFNNWCALTRSYYMRLVCWRMCRDSGTANQLDSKIFLLVSQRLKTTWAHYLWLRNNARASPSTIPSLPAPSKRFIIIRSEVVQPQPGLLMPFDSFPNPIPDSAQGPFFGGLVGRDEPESPNHRLDPNQATYKRRWSLLGKVLSLSAGTQATLGLGTGAEASRGSGKRTWEEELEQARRETAASRSRANSVPLPAGPPPPPKASDMKSSSASDSSGGSSPMYEPSQYVFRFGLQQYNFQTKAIILAPPRLPAPAQARVSSARAALSNSDSNGGVTARSDSPPPIAPGLPPPTRRFSGLMNTGLINEARNAQPLDVLPPRSEKKSSVQDLIARTLSNGSKASSTDSCDTDDDAPFHTPPEEPVSEMFPPAPQAIAPAFNLENEIRQQQSAVQATKPEGIYVVTATYTGRALAEWSIVVNENNSFVDRRRDEGVLGLASVEVPVLSMEGLGFRMRG